MLGWRCFGRMKLLVSFVSLWLALTVGGLQAQSNEASPPPAPPEKIQSPADLDAFINGKVVPKSLPGGQDYALQWQAWYKRNAPIHERLKYDYLLLQARYQTVEEENERLASGTSQARF